MLKTLIQKELLQQLHSHKFVISTVISICLMLLCLHISAENYLKKLAEYDRAVSNQRLLLTQMESATEANVRQFDFRSFHDAIFRKPTPLSIFCQGMENQLGEVGQIDVLRVPFLAQPISKMGYFNQFDLNELLERFFAEIDFVLVVQIILSLMAVFIAFDLVTGEREAGVLKLTLAYNVARLNLITAKWLAGNLILIISVLFGVLVGFIYLQFVQNILFSGAEIIRLAGLFLLSLLYLLFFFQLALFFSCLSRSSQQAIISLIWIWMLLLFIGPDLSIVFGKQIAPIPVLDFLETEERKLEQKFDHLKYQTNDREERDKIREQEKQAEWQLRQHYLNQLKSQKRTVVQISSLSPASAFQFAAEYLAGTSVNDYEHFMERVRLENQNYSEIFKRTIMPKTFEEGRQRFLQLGNLLKNASSDSNRLSLQKSCVNASPFVFWLVLLNSILFTGTVVYFDRKTIVL